MKNTPTTGFEWVGGAAIFACVWCDETIAIQKKSVSAPIEALVAAEKRLGKMESAK